MASETLVHESLVQARAKEDERLVRVRVGPISTIRAGASVMPSQFPTKVSFVGSFFPFARERTPTTCALAFVRVPLKRALYHL